MITTKQTLVDTVYADYCNNSVELSMAYFDFDVWCMPKNEILSAYKELQWMCNGDVVEFPPTDGVYTGKCSDFLEECGRDPRYRRYDDENEYDFVF